MKIASYWLMRMALFFAVLVAFWAMGWRHWSVALGAGVIAWLISYALLGPMYDAAAQQMERVLTGRVAWMRSDDHAEDAEAGSPDASDGPPTRKRTPRPPQT